MNKTEKYLKTFFEEKNLPFVTWTIEENGTNHFVDNRVVIEFIMNLPETQMKQVADKIRKLDFANADINHFLKHAAHGMIKSQQYQN